MKKTAIRIATAVMVLVLLFSLGACGKAETVSLKMGTGGTTGTYYAFGSVVANILSEKLENVQITAVSTNASKANIFEIEDKNVDIALVQNDVMDYAYKGDYLFAADGAVTAFSAMAGVYAEVCQIVARPGINSIADLAGLSVSIGDAGSGVEFNARQILAAYGIDADTGISKKNLGFGDSADAFKDGKIDAFFCVAGAPTTAIVELATSNQIQILEIDDEHADAIIAQYPFYTKFAVPAGSYKGVDADMQTLAVKATFIVSNDLSEDVVYEMTKALFGFKDEIAAAHDKGKSLDAAYAVEGISVPFHPGAAKYFKEVGVL